MLTSRHYSWLSRETGRRDVLPTTDFGLRKPYLILGTREMLRHHVNFMRP